MSSEGPAVVVGGASGIGAGVVERLRQAGAPLVVWDVKDPCDLRCDVRDPAQIEAAATETLERLGPPTTVTVSAGVGHAGTLAGSSAEDWDRVMSVNARGPWLALRSLAGAMDQAGGGSMVVVSSVSARLADRTMGLYGASKAALEMIVKVAAREWAPSLRVNAVAPGVTDTPMLGPIPRTDGWLGAVGGRTALGRLGEPEEVADAVIAVHRLGWLTGAVVTCDGGLSLFSPIDPPGGDRA